MNPGRFIRYIRQYARRKDIDWTLNKGDFVVAENHWPSPIEIVDINWALWAAAVELAPGCIVVWPLWGLRRV